MDVKLQIHVATSDLTEQRVIFGQGALRKSARELEIEMEDISTKYYEESEAYPGKEAHFRIPLSAEVAEIFEKWRRGMK